MMDKYMEILFAIVLTVISILMMAILIITSIGLFKCMNQ